MIHLTKSGIELVEKHRIAKVKVNISYTRSDADADDLIQRAVEVMVKRWLSEHGPRSKFISCHIVDEAPGEFRNGRLHGRLDVNVIYDLIEVEDEGTDDADYFASVIEALGGKETGYTNL